MREKKLVLTLLALTAFYGCSEDFDYSDYVVEKPVLDDARCKIEFGIEESDVWYNYSLGPQSFVQVDACRKATSFLSSKLDGAECVGTSSYTYDYGDYDLYVDYKDSTYKMEVYVQGCEFKLKSDLLSSDMDPIVLDPCVCKRESGYVYYRQDDQDIQVGSSSSYEGTSYAYAYSSSSAYEKVKTQEPVACPEIARVYELSGYSVAYEFDDPNDLGRDYVGNNHALIETGMAVDGDCNNLVLDGTNGLYVPLSPVFKTSGFIAEVRFNADEKADMGNIFVAEPPGSGRDGWQIRLDGDVVRFHVRDAALGNEWTVIPVGTVTMKEWHVIRVELGLKVPEGSTEIQYMLDLTLDGELKYSEPFRGDVFQLNYDLGIGYDSQHQSAYGRKFFKGKIDYIRYASK